MKKKIHQWYKEIASVKLSRKLVLTGDHLVRKFFRKLERISLSPVIESKIRLIKSILDISHCPVPKEQPEEAIEPVVPEIEEKPITEVLDFAMREIVKQDSLTDELICPMLRTVPPFHKKSSKIKVLRLKRFKLRANRDHLKNPDILGAL